MNHRGDHGPLMEPRNRNCKSWASLGVRRGKRFYFYSVHILSGKISGRRMRDDMKRTRTWRLIGASLWWNVRIECMSTLHIQCVVVYGNSVGVQTMLSSFHWRSRHPEMLFCRNIPPLCRPTLSYLGLCSKISVGGRETVLIQYPLIPGLHTTWIMYLYKTQWTV